MVAYVTLGARDLDASVEFYSACLATIGWTSHNAFDGWRAYSRGGTGEGVTLWICSPFNGEPGSAGNGTMVALEAPDRAAVDAFHAAGLSHGGVDDGAPGLRPHYGPDWYSAYLRDPTGNKICVYINR